jgi:hypothetical protein
MKRKATAMKPTAKIRQGVPMIHVRLAIKTAMMIAAAQA